MWTMVPHCLVRSAAFPVADLAKLRMAGTAAAARTLRDAEQSVRDLATERGWSAEATDRVLERLASGAPVRARDRAGSDLVARYRRARHDLAAAAAAERVSAEKWLREFVRTERVREVLALTNPGLLRDLDRGRWNDRLRCQSASYVQRLAAKNETTSFFGPISYGIVETAGEDRLELRWPGPQRLTGRRAHLAAWVVETLVRAVAFAAPVAPWLVLRRRPGIPVGDLTLDGVAARLLATVDGRATLRALAGRLRTTVGELVTAAESLVDAGLATHQLQPPATAPDPLLFMIGRLAYLPSAGRERVLAVLAALAELRDGFSSDSVAGKLARYDAVVRAVTCLAGDRPAGGAGAAAGRSRAGQFYADRLALREECAGALALAVRGLPARRLVDVATPALEFLARVATRRRNLARKLLARQLGVRRVPLWRLAAKLGDQPPPPDRALLAALAAAVPAGVAEWDLAGAGLGDLLAEPAGGVVCSVDLMIVASDLRSWQSGDYDLVLADVHDTALLTDWSLQFHADPEAVRAATHLATARAMGGRPVVCVMSGRRTGIPPLEPPTCLVELGTVAGQANPWRVGLDDLEVVSDGQRVQLVSRTLDSEVELYNGELDNLVQTAFGSLRLGGADFRFAPCTPRLRVGPAVVQRRRWQVPVADLRSLRPPAADDAETLLRASRVWHRYDLPDEVYAILPGERKPMYTTADSPYLLRALARRAERATGQALVSEAFPPPDRLWLSAPDGTTYTSELRCVFVRSSVECGDA